jgi:hypothetical protein
MVDRNDPEEIVHLALEAARRERPRGEGRDRRIGRGSEARPS